MTIGDITLAVFTVFNTFRFLAYVPQIRSAIKDESGAEAISFGTWSLFLVSHLSAMAYAIENQKDWTMASLFMSNAIGCATILLIASWKRSRHRGRMAGAQRRGEGSISTDNTAPRTWQQSLSNTLMDFVGLSRIGGASKPSQSPRGAQRGPRNSCEFRNNSNPDASFQARDGDDAGLPMTLVIFFLNVQSSYAENAEAPASATAFDTLQFFQSESGCWRIKTYAMDQDVHVWRLRREVDDVALLARVNAEKHYGDVIGDCHIIQSETGMDGVRLGLLERGLPSRIETARSGFLFWMPEGARYRTKTKPGSNRPSSTRAHA